MNFLTFPSKMFIILHKRLYNSYKRLDILHKSPLRFTGNRSLGGHDPAHLLEMQ